MTITKEQLDAWDGEVNAAYKSGFAAGAEAKLAELAGVEMPEPFGLFCGIRHDPPKTKEFWGMLNQNTDPQQKCNLYTADQMREYAAAAVAKEREACAKVCDFEWGTGAEKDAGIMFAAVIRARGNT
jgi:hypothetical protein